VAENNSQQQSNPFNSFWMAGYECADQMNAFGQRVDLLSATGHLDIIEEDYQNLGLFNMTTVREGVRWSVVEKQPYVYDWSVVGKMLDAGKTCNIQQVWDLCHFGFPDDLSPLHPMFAKRFASFCNSFVHYYRTKLPDDILVLTPINEVSFLSWRWFCLFVQCHLGCHIVNESSRYRGQLPSGDVLTFKTKDLFFSPAHKIFPIMPLLIALFINPGKYQ